MKIKISDYIARFLAEHGVDTVFTITGGGAMHLNDSFGHYEGLRCIYQHNEQACTIAAEGYARYRGKMAAACVTSGPGGTNAISGVYGAWVDSLPMIVISGQVKRETLIMSSKVPLRQLGDQECNIVELVKSITKSAVMITNPNEIRFQLERAVFLAMSGRKGPVWIDVPLDIQAASVYLEELTPFNSTHLEAQEIPVYNTSNTDRILEKIRNARRPVILAGEGIRLGHAVKEFMETTNSLKIPVAAAWNNQDILWDSNAYYVGIPGTVGMRAANFIVQSADLLLVLGCRMNIRIISYNTGEFAKNAFKIVVDIDKNELEKPTVKVDMPIHADVKDVCRDLAGCISEEVGDHSVWLNWCKELYYRYPAVKKEYFAMPMPMNPYAFIYNLSDYMNDSDVVVCGNGSACVITFQAFCLKQPMRIFTNSGSASMGYALPAAIGAAAARGGRRVVCIDGDGSFMMNVQELATAAYNRLNIKIIILNNNGYHSIRQTQRNIFASHTQVGVDGDSGIGFPDFEKLSASFGIPYIRIDSLNGMGEKVEKLLSSTGPMLCEAVVDCRQNFEPKLSSKVMPDGSMVSPPLDDMYPFLPEEEYRAVREEALSL